MSRFKAVRCDACWLVLEAIDTGHVGYRDGLPVYKLPPGWSSPSPGHDLCPGCAMDHGRIAAEVRKEPLYHEPPERGAAS